MKNAPAVVKDEGRNVDANEPSSWKEPSVSESVEMIKKAPIEI